MFWTVVQTGSFSQFQMATACFQSQPIYSKCLAQFAKMRRAWNWTLCRELLWSALSCKWAHLQDLKNLVTGRNQVIVISWSTVTHLHASKTQVSHHSWLSYFFDFCTCKNGTTHKYSHKDILVLGKKLGVFKQWIITSSLITCISKWAKNLISFRRFYQSRSPSFCCSSGTVWKMNALSHREPSFSSFRACFSAS